MYTIKDVLEILGIAEIQDMLNSDLRNPTLLSKVVIELNEDQIEDEPNFLDWLKGKGKFFIRLFLSLPFLVTIYVMVWHFMPESSYPFIVGFLPKDSKSLQGILGVIILIVITAVIIHLVLHRSNTSIPANNKFVNRAIESADTIFQYWLYIWITWFLFYLTLTFEWLKDSGKIIIQIQPFAFYALENLFNNSSAILFFCIYYEMSRETKNKDASKFKNLPIPFLLINAIFFLIELIILSQRAGNIGDMKDAHFYFALFSGLCNGIAMGLFISRLESIIFNTPLFLVIVFTMYAVIQPTSYFLTDDKYKGLSFIILLLAFYGKILLFITLTWLKDTNRFIYYLVRWLYIYQQEVDLKLRGLFFKKLIDEENASIEKQSPNNVAEK